MKLRRNIVLCLVLIASFAVLSIWNSPTVRSQPPMVQRIESNAIQVIRVGKWVNQSASAASGGSYLYNANPSIESNHDQFLEMEFSGSSLEIIYVSGPSLGTLAIEVDGTVLRTVMTTAESVHYEQVVKIDYLTPETHTLRVYAQSGGVVGIDAFAVMGITTSPDTTQSGLSPRAPCNPSSGVIQRASVSSNGPFGNHNAVRPSISDDGRLIVFQSEATDLVSGDTNAATDIFLHDRQTCQTTRISIATNGTEANGNSQTPVISGNGRYVAFESSATNLVANDTNGQSDIFLADLQTGQITRVVGNARWPSLSDDGRYLSFITTENIDPLDSGTSDDVYLWDTQTQLMTVASVSPTGQVVGNNILYQFLSGNGQFIAFSSNDSRLVPPDTNAYLDVFVRDLQLGQTTLISRNASGDVGNDASTVTGISDNGRYVTYASRASNLVTPDPYSTVDAFVYDRQTGNTRLLSRATSGSQITGNGNSGNYSIDYPFFPTNGMTISGNGRYIVFVSAATNLTTDPDSSSYSIDLFLYDQQTQQLRRLTLEGTQPFFYSSYWPALSDDGNTLAFFSSAEPDTSGTFHNQVYLYDRMGGATPTTISATALSDSEIRVQWVDGSYDESGYRIQRSPNGLDNWVEIGVTSANTNQFTDISLLCNTTLYYRVQGFRTGEWDAPFSIVVNATTTPCPITCDNTSFIQLASVRSNGVQSTTGAYNPVLSANGRYVAFYTGGALTTNDTNSNNDVYVRDMLTCQIWQISAVMSGQTADTSGGENPDISGDGRYVVFSSSSALVSGDTNNERDVYLHDRQTGQTRRISVGAGGVQANHQSFGAIISTDGRYIAYNTDATNLALGGAGVMVYDTQTQQSLRIDSGYVLDISADGSRVLVMSRNYAPLEYLRVWNLGSYLTVYEDIDNDSSVFGASLSNDGRYVVFDGGGHDFGQRGTYSVYRYDLVTSELEQISPLGSLIGPSEQSSVRDHAISADGRFTTYMSSVEGIVPGVDTNGRDDIYLYDAQTEQLRLVSINGAGELSNMGAYFSAISDNGQFVAFESSSSNLVAGDANSSSDIFVVNLALLPNRFDLAAMTLSTSAIQLTWADVVSGETSWIVERSSNGLTGWSPVATLTADSTSYQDNGVVCSNQYFYRVRAFTAGSSTYSSYSTIAFAITNQCVSCDWNNSIHRVSIGTGDVEANGPSGGEYGTIDSMLSSTGRYVAFESLATNLVANDTNAVSDIFVHDRQTCTTLRVSVATDGTQANGPSTLPHMTPDGRYVSFSSDASNLVANDTNGVADIFIHDTQTGETFLVSPTPPGESPWDSTTHDLSADGRYIVYVLQVTNYWGSQSRIYVYDRQSTTSELISATPSHQIPNGPSDSPSISDDGRYVAFRSYASDLIPNDTNSREDVFVFDRQNHQMQRVSLTPSGGQSTSQWVQPHITGNGLYVVMNTYASIYLYDLQAGQNILVSLNWQGQPLNGSSTAADVSSDGRYVVFRSIASNILQGGNSTGIFLRDRLTNQVRQLSVSSLGIPSDGSLPHISDDGNVVIFTSDSSSLVPGDFNYIEDVFAVTVARLPIVPVLNVNNITRTQAELSWTGMFPISVSYLIQRAGGGAGWQTIATVPDTQFVYLDLTLQCGTYYQYRVQAYNTLTRAYSGYSNVVSVVAQACPPNVPSNLTATVASQTQINLNWTDNSSDETQFRIERSPDGLTNWMEIGTVPANIVTYTNVSLICNTSYHYRARAYRASDSAFSAYSNVANATTNACPVIAPSSLSLTVVSATQLNLAWTDNSSDETQFRIERSPDGLTNWMEIGTVPANTVTYTNVSLICNTSYHYRVRAYRASDSTYSAYSNVANATTNTCPVIAPSGLSLTVVSTAQLNLAWTDNSSDETQFRIERSLDGITGWTEVTQVGAGVTSYQDLILQCGTTYHYRVRAYRASDSTYSAYSEITNATTAACRADTLALFNPTTHTGNLIRTLTNPPVASDYVYYTTGFPYGAGGQYVMGDWNADGLDTMGVYLNGAFWYTNSSGQTGSWTGIWFGLGGQAIAGRFNGAVGHDCIGVTDSGTWTTGDTFFALYFTCNLTSGPTPTLTYQWLSIVLPTSAGHSGSFQFSAGDLDGDGVDSIAIRRGNYIAWTNVPPTTLLSEFSLAQYFGAPGTGDEGKFVVGDWDLNNVDSFGLVYQNGRFYRREDLQWNSGAYTLQQFTPLVGTPFGVTTWRPN